MRNLAAAIVRDHHGIPAPAFNHRFADQAQKTIARCCNSPTTLGSPQARRTGQVVIAFMANGVNSDALSWPEGVAEHQLFLRPEPLR